jgi:hypothetical protein
MSDRGEGDRKRVYTDGNAQVDRFTPENKKELYRRPPVRIYRVRLPLLSAYCYACTREGIPDRVPVHRSVPGEASRQASKFVARRRRVRIS